MKYSLCIDLLYLEIGEKGPIFSNTEKLLNGMELAKKAGYQAVEFWDWATLTDPTTFEKAVQGMKETIAVAKKFDCPNIIITADKNVTIEKKQEHNNIVEGLKLLYDIFHYQLMEGNIVNTIKSNVDLIGHIHAASSPSKFEITDGELNYSYIIQSIKETGYDRDFGIEYLPTTDKETSVMKCKKLIEANI